MASLIVKNRSNLRNGRAWNAFDDFESLVDRIFSNYYNCTNCDSSAQMPIELCEQGNSLVLKAILPGLKKEQINIEVSEDQVSLSGEYRSENEENNDQVYRSEFYAGRFERVIPLPQKIDHQKAKADYKDGVLTLTLPKSEKEINRVVRLSL